MQICKPYIVSDSKVTIQLVCIKLYFRKFFNPSLDLRVFKDFSVQEIVPSLIIEINITISLFYKLGFWHLQKLHVFFMTGHQALFFFKQTSEIFRTNSSQNFFLTISYTNSNEFVREGGDCQQIFNLFFYLIFSCFQRHNFTNKIYCIVNLIKYITYESLLLSLV